MQGRDQGPARACTRAAVVLVAVIIGLVPTVTAHGTAEGTSRLRSMVARVRRAEGVPALSTDKIADRLAQHHSERMARAGRLYHNDRLGAEAVAAGLDWSVIGENVGVGPSIDTVHYGFMDSASHRHTTLDRRYSLIGIGIARTSDRVYVTQVFAATFAEPSDPVDRAMAQTCAPHIAEDGSSVAPSFYGAGC